MGRLRFGRRESEHLREPAWFLLQRDESALQGLAAAPVFLGGLMIATCANPDCNVPFRYFRAGQLFMVEAHERRPRWRTGHSKRGIEHFWLCGDCAPTMHLMRTTDGAVTVCRALQPFDPAAAPRIAFARRSDNLDQRTEGSAA
jgi:hypothetical protein